MSRRLVTITKNGTNPAYQGARGGVDRLAAARHVSVRHLVPEVPDSIPEQIGFLKSLLDDRPDAILLAPAHLTQLDDVLEAVRATGIPILMFVARTARDNCVAFVGSDDFSMTYDVGKRVGEEIGGRGSVAIMDGNPLGINYKDRAGGFRKAMAEFPDIDVVATRIGDFLREPARDAMREILDEHPRLDAVLSANDFMSIGIIDALRERGAKAVIGSVNATPDGVAAIKAGAISVTAGFNAMAMGCLALEAAIRHLDGIPIPKEIILPVELVTRANLADWDKPYPERPLPDWDAVVGRERSRAPA